MGDKTLVLKRKVKSQQLWWASGFSSYYFISWKESQSKAVVRDKAKTTCILFANRHNCFRKESNKIKPTANNPEIRRVKRLKPQPQSRLSSEKRKAISKIPLSGGLNG